LKFKRWKSYIADVVDYIFVLDIILSQQLMGGDTDDMALLSVFPKRIWKSVFDHVE
jgi:hypothetical protein